MARTDAKGVGRACVRCDVTFSSDIVNRRQAQGQSIPRRAKPIIKYFRIEVSCTTRNRPNGQSVASSLWRVSVDSIFTYLTRQNRLSGRACFTSRQGGRRGASKFKVQTEALNSAAGPVRVCTPSLPVGDGCQTSGRRDVFERGATWGCDPARRAGPSLAARRFSGPAMRSGASIASTFVPK
jgi:hypothetical protein